MAINFPNSPSDGDTHTAGGKTFTYDATAGVWNSSGSGVTEFTGLSDTPSTLGTAGQIAKVNSGATALEFADPSGVTVYATADLLPGTANAGDMAFVTATNRLYLWNGSGWYNIALINTNPTISGVSSSYALATDGTATTVTITATDPEGVPITYSIASDTSGNIATVTQGTGSSSNVFTITPSTNNANGGSFSLTFRASDGVNIASSVSTFTLTFSITNSKYTTALITSVGANNADNNDFIDSSGNSHTITAYGDATQGSFSPFRQSGYSWQFDSSNDFIEGPAVDLMGSGAFTVECWAYVRSTGSTYTDAFLGQYQSNQKFIFGAKANVVRVWMGGSEVRVGTTNIIGEWHHIALVRDSSNSCQLYIDGVAEGAAFTNTTDFSTALENFEIGSWDNGAGSDLDGYITDLRVVKGTAVYTAAFTPPEERLTAITNTSLLLGNLPYLADGSTNNHKLTSNGNVSMEPFTPYDNGNEYTSSTDGGSIFFNGTNAYLRADTALDSMTSGDTEWTLEAWVYPNNLGGTGTTSEEFFGCNRTSDGLNVITLGPKQIRIDGTDYTNLTDLVAKQWSHVALVYHRGYNGLRYYINGYHVNSYNPSASQPALAGCAFGIGCEFDGSSLNPGNYFDGLLSDVRVSDHDIYGVSSSYTPTNPPTQEFTPPTAPLTATSDTDFLLHATNAAIIDKSQSCEFVKVEGSSTASTTQTKYLDSSVQLTGTNPNVQIELPEALGSVFTMEGWFYVTNYNTYGGFFSGSNNNTNSNARGISVSYDQIYSDTQTTLISWNSTRPTNAWVHIAVTSDGTTLRAFVDGTLQTDTHTTVSNFTQTTTTYRIGARYNSGASALYTLTGFFSDVRFTKGLARYTANFTPPTAALKG